MARDKRSSRATPESDELRLSSNSPSEDSTADDLKEYEVADIVSHRIDKNGKIVYMIAWVGYPDVNDNTEAYEDDLTSCRDVLRRYKEENDIGSKKKIASTARKSTREVYASPAASDNGSVAESDAILLVSDDDSESLASTRKNPRRKITQPSSSTRSTRSQRTPSVAEKTPPAQPSAGGTSKRRRGVAKEEDVPNKVSRDDKTPAAKAGSAWVSSESPELVSQRQPPATIRNASSVNSNSPVTEADKNCGLFNHLKVEQVSQIKSLGDGSTTVKVTYKNAPARFKKSEYVDVRYVRYFAPQKLIDHLLSLVTADSP